MRVVGTWALSLLALILAGCSAQGLTSDEATREEITNVREILGLDYPYHLELWDSYLDGGTLGVRVRDRWGRRLSFSLDGRMQEIDFESLRVDDTLRVAPRHFFLGADYPDKRGARELPIRGKDELAILDMLDLISLEYFPRARRDLLVASYRLRPRSDDETSAMLHRLTKAELSALRAGSLSKSRREMDIRGEIVDVGPPLRHRPPHSGGAGHPQR